MTRALTLLLLIPWSVSAAPQSPATQTALNYLRDNHERHLDKQVQIAEVAAPTFREGERAKLMAEEFRRAGLAQVEIDKEGNVLGWRRGSSPDVLVIAAHLDIAFEPNVDVRVRKEGPRWHGPGLADDSRGLVTLIAVAEALEAGGILTRCTLLFVANTGEEGLGDLKGVKYLFQEHPARARFKAFISVDGPSLDKIIVGGTGVKRYKITARGPGGHSFADFGRPSANHTLGRIVSRLADLEVPSDPKTTYNIGRIEGGTTVNAIAEEGSMEVDLRSDSSSELRRIEDALMEAVKAGAALENRQRAASKTVVTTQIELIGNRPAGRTSVDDPLVRAAVTAGKSLGLQPTFRLASTDSNWPMSLGIPAVTISGGGASGDAHSLAEWFEPANAWQGPQALLLTILNYDGNR